MLPPRGYLFIVLNAVRALSIIGLLLVFSSNVVVLADDIKAVNRFMSVGSAHSDAIADNSTSFDCDLDYIDGSTVPNQPAGVFWAVVNRLLIIFQVIVLVLSEMGWPQKFFNSFFPVLGSDFGLGPLGVFECLIGAAVLSHHIGTFPMVAAFFLFSVGCLNIFLGLLFRGKARQRRSLTSFKESGKSLLPKVADDTRSVQSGVLPSAISNPFDTDKTRGMGFGRQLENTTGYGFGAQGEKKAGLKGYLLAKPVETLPRYMPKSTATNPEEFASSETAV